jgi:hypothetical protein
MQGDEHLVHLDDDSDRDLHPAAGAVTSEELQFGTFP